MYRLKHTRNSVQKERCSHKIITKVSVFIKKNCNGYIHLLVGPMLELLGGDLHKRPGVLLEIAPQSLGNHCNHSIATRITLVFHRIL